LIRQIRLIRVPLTRAPELPRLNVGLLAIASGNFSQKFPRNPDQNLHRPVLELLADISAIPKRCFWPRTMMGPYNDSPEIRHAS
jgi:hypothetical protein